MNTRILCNWSIWIFVFGLMTGCKGLKNIGSDEADARGWKATLSKAEKEIIDFNGINISGKAMINMPKADLEGMSVKYRMAIIKDSVILIRLNKIIEIARVKITPDSIYVLDKINKVLITCDFSLAEEYTGLKADFGMIQDLFLGNYHQIPEKVMYDRTSSNPRVFRGTFNGTEFTYFINKDNFKVVKIETKNALKSQKSAIIYSGFDEYGGTLVPMNTLISVSAPETMSIEFEHQKFQLNPDQVYTSLGSVSAYEKTDCK